MIHPKITESAIEQFAIELLEKAGYQYVYGPDIAPDGVTPERRSFEDVLLFERLTAAIARINPNVPADVREDAVKQLLRFNSPELISNKRYLLRQRRAPFSPLSLKPFAGWTPGLLPRRGLSSP